eukprot:872539-Prymnesium_polylepis.1
MPKRPLDRSRRTTCRGGERAMRWQFARRESAASARRHPLKQACVLWLWRVSHAHSIGRDAIDDVVCR